MEERKQRREIWELKNKKEGENKEGRKMKGKREIWES